MPTQTMSDVPRRSMQSRPGSSQALQSNPMTPMTWEPDGPPLVHIVEDDDDTRRALEALVAAQGYDAVAFADGNSFLAGYQSGRPGCVILDLRLPDISGLQVLEACRTRETHVSPIVFVTAHGETQAAVAAMKSQRVLDFVEKPFAPKSLLHLIEHAIEADRTVLRLWMEWHDMERRRQTLSKREREVAQAMLAGKSNKQIAIDLDVSHKTVSTHRTHVLKKLDCTSLVELVRRISLAPPSDLMRHAASA